MTSRLTRPMLGRIVFIHQRLRQDKYPTALALAQELEVSHRTIYRDIEYMRSFMSAPIAFDRSRQGYFYTEAGYVLPSIELTEGELVSIFIAEKALQQYSGTPYERGLRGAFRKILSFLPEEITIDLSGIDDALSFQSTATTVQDIQSFSILANAVLKISQPPHRGSAPR